VKRSYPAFPAGQLGNAGMELRDFFAAAAMTSFIAKTQAFDGIDLAGNIAFGAYRVADAMLAQREHDDA